MSHHAESPASSASPASSVSDSGSDASPDSPEIGDGGGFLYGWIVPLDATLSPSPPDEDESIDESYLELNPGDSIVLVKVGWASTHNLVKRLNDESVAWDELAGRDLGIKFLHPSDDTEVELTATKWTETLQRSGGAVALFEAQDWVRNKNLLFLVRRKLDSSESTVGYVRGTGVVNSGENLLQNLMGLRVPKAAIDEAILAAGVSASVKNNIGGSEYIITTRSWAVAVKRGFVSHIAEHDGVFGGDNPFGRLVRRILLDRATFCEADCSFRLVVRTSPEIYISRERVAVILHMRLPRWAPQQPSAFVASVNQRISESWGLCRRGVDGVSADVADTLAASSSRRAQQSWIFVPVIHAALASIFPEAARYAVGGCGRIYIERDIPAFCTVMGADTWNRLVGAFSISLSNRGITLDDVPIDDRGYIVREVQERLIHYDDIDCASEELQRMQLWALNQANVSAFVHALRAPSSVRH